MLSVFLHNLVSYSRFFCQEQVDHLEPMLCCPVDGLVLARLNSLGHRQAGSTISSIDSRAKFWAIQDLLEQSANTVGVPRVWFDDNWGDPMAEGLPRSTSG